jgi:hypothetical protein
MPRPSPRTLGKTVDPETGEEVFFTKFGTQQLKFIDSTKPALGVREVIPPSVDPFGGSLKGFFGSKTVRDTAYPDLTITKGVGTGVKKPLTPFEFPDFEFPDLFGAIDKHGCECEACKNGTGQCSDKRAECDAWDLGCELGGGFTDVITNPVSSWWDKYGIWVYVILGVIGLGILLWLLRPLFGVAKNVTGITKSAVTRVNGMK